MPNREDVLRILSTPPNETFNLPHTTADLYAGLPTARDLWVAFIELSLHLVKAREFDDEMERLTKAWNAASLRSPEYIGSNPETFENLISTAKGIKIKLSDDQRLSDCMSSLDRFVSLLEATETLKTEDVLVRLRVGDLEVIGPAGVLRNLAETDVRRLASEHYLALEAAERTAQRAFDAAMKEASAKADAQFRNGLLRVLANHAQDLARQHGWKTEEVDGYTVYTVGSESNLETIKLPNPQS